MSANQISAKPGHYAIAQVEAYVIRCDLRFELDHGPTAVMLPGMVQAGTLYVPCHWYAPPHLDVIVAGDVWREHVVEVHGGFPIGGVQ